MGRNNEDFHEGKDIPGFEGTMAAFNNLIKSGQSIVNKRKEEDLIEDSFARADMERDK